MEIEQLDIETEGHKSKILIGEQLTAFSKYIPGKNTAIVTDENIMRHYGSLFEGFPTIVLGTGEKNKTLTTIDFIMEKLVETGADRSWFLLGVGGGIVCDTTGFAGSVFMRGIPFGFVSTTLLSQVDASVGGKNGVNHRGYKNMIGTFNQPEFVICDHSLLKTLEKKEFLSGFAEIVKHGAIRSLAHFEYLEKNLSLALAANNEVIHKLVCDSVNIKAQVVRNDEREQGERRILNFGHTLGHSIEKITGVTHGEAISLGMILAAKLSVKKGYLHQAEEERLSSLLQRIGLPVQPHVDAHTLIDTMLKDKKRDGDNMHFVFLKGLGNAVSKKISITQLEKLIYDLY
jgi:3-dehydroquinate synthase